MDNYKPSFVDVIFSYMGLVIPMRFLNYDYGQKYGNGEFGKFIFSLVLLSVGLIFMGSITIVVFLIALSVYMVKALSMFTSNVEEKKKK